LQRQSPATATVAAGATSGTFIVTVSAVSSVTNVTITATDESGG
jgi:hypothetical protein